MTPPAAGNPVDEVMAKASRALARRKYFEAERLALQALQNARDAGDFERMARIALPLLEARRQRLQQALDAKKIAIIDQAFDDETVKLRRGCYLVQPPLVGADARRLRLAGLRHEVPIAVLCREPLTQLRQCPVVAMCSGLTIRVRIDAPAKPSNPGMAWFVGALEALGDSALESIDPKVDADRRVEAILCRLDAHPDHEELHQALIEACREASKVKSDRQAAAAARAKCQS